VERDTPKVQQALVDLREAYVKANTNKVPMRYIAVEPPRDPRLFPFEPLPVPQPDDISSAMGKGPGVNLSQRYPILIIGDPGSGEHF
jgi:hypothetical protein